MCYQLFENNGVLKRESVNEYIKKLNQEDRKILRNKGIKIGRYHIFLFRIFKPSAVSTRILLWKNFYRKNLNLKPPKFGLNFLELKENIDQKLMLICGFEKFSKFFIRIDILERLFVKIIEKEKKQNKIKLEADMLNLLGCNKENFVKLLELMEYKVEKDDKEEIYFKYSPKKNKISKKSVKKNKRKDNPFSILTGVNFN